MKWLTTIINEVIPGVGEGAQFGKIFDQNHRWLWCLGFLLILWIHMGAEKYECILATKDMNSNDGEEYEFISQTYEFICHNLPTMNS